ncbi:MAG: hypothetical protein OEV30_10840 [Ignavibacteria bacterium]|nr:hypothetical protein [Ignavibacteria bacterium]
MSVADSLREFSRRLDILTEEFENMRLGEVADTTIGQSGGMGPAGGRVYTRTGTGVSIAGYGEMVYENHATTGDDGTVAGKKDMIDFLRAVVYFGYRYNDWILFNSEIEFEHASTGSGGEVSVEFAYVELMAAPFANIRAGMLLAPVGIVNEKHEPSTFFGTLRPQVEQSIIPTTWRANGAGAYGRILPGLGYTAYVLEGLDATGFSASSGIRGGRQKGAKALAENFGFAGRIDFYGLPGTTLGASIFTGASGQGATDSLGVICANTTVASIHGEFAWKGIELRGLYAQTTIGDAGRLSVMNGEVIGSSMHGWYISGGYDVVPLFDPSSEHYLAPYIQYEQFNTQAEVSPGFSANPANDRAIMTIGLMYKPHPNVAFKGDYRDNKNEAGTAINQWNVAVNYLF